MSDPVIIDYPTDREALAAQLKQVVDTPDFTATTESAKAFLARHGVSAVGAYEALPVEDDLPAEVDAAEQP